MAAGYSSLVHINSLNINGLEGKLNKLTDFILQNNTDILLLQETHKIHNGLIQKHLGNHGLRTFLNKVVNEHNNYDGTAFVFNSKISDAFEIQHNVLQSNRLQKLTLVNDEKEVILFCIICIFEVVVDLM